MSTEDKYKKTYYLTCMQLCEECDGAGAVENPAWNVFHEWYKRYESKYKRLPTPEEIDSFIFQSGLENEPEELVCSECGGEGRLVMQVRLEDALLDVLKDNAVGEQRLNESSHFIA